MSIMDTFDRLTETDIRKVMKRSSKAICFVVSLHVCLVECLDVLIRSNVVIILKERLIRAKMTLLCQLRKINYLNGFNPILEQYY